MKRHRHYQQLIGRREELTLGEEREVQAHMAECPDCRAVAGPLAGQRSLLLSLQPSSPPVQLRAKVLERVDQITLSSASPELSRHSRVRSRRVLLAIALCLAIVAAGITGVRAANGIWFNGGELSDKGDAVKYYCIQGSLASGSAGYDAYKAPVPGRPCFINRDDAERALGVPASAFTSSIPPDVKEAGPPGTTFEDGSAPGHTCSVSVPANMPAGERAFVHCADGTIAMVFSSPPIPMARARASS